MKIERGVNTLVTANEKDYPKSSPPEIISLAQCAWEEP